MFPNFKRSVSAKVIGSTLVAAFRKSEPPLIWKFDLERNHSFTLALQGEEGELELGVTSPKGEFYSVARFAAREDAEQAFTAVQKALLSRKRNWLKLLLSWVAGILLLMLLALLISGFFSVTHFMDSVSSLSGSGLPGIPNGIPNGVPLPADRVLIPPH